MWVRVTPGSSLLLDCGEGTLAQLRRQLGPAGSRDALRSLGVVWVSHRHADHMAGVPALLRALAEQGSPPPLLLGPRSLERWLGLDVNATGVPGTGSPAAAPTGLLPGPTATPARPEFLHPRQLGSPAAQARLRARCAGLAGLQACPAVHCSDAWCVRADCAGFSLAYTGDTVPCPALRALCSPAPTVLVHEATFGPGRASDAARKKHCTTADALALAAAARPALTVLTHFSQRYPRYPDGVLGADGDDCMPGVGVAFDGMRLPLAAMHLLPGVQPLLRDLLEKREGEALA